MDQSKYVLATVLEGHTQDVKALDTFADDTIVSCSRDTILFLWKKENDGSWFKRENFKSSSFINSVCILPSHALVASAGLDFIINISSMQIEHTEASDPIESAEFVLLGGHDKNICSLACFDDLILSSSWDKTAAVWQKNELKYKLIGHEAAVWDAQFLTKDKILTCSADRTIKLWDRLHVIKSYDNIHNDVVRSLIVLPKKNQFISASNDGSIKVVDIDTGKILKSMFTLHFVYKIKLLNDNTLISCGEDRAVKIWNIDTGDVIQSFLVPSISVWSVATLSNNDICVGGSDCKVYVFSKDPSRQNKLLQQSLDEEIANSAINTEQIDSKSVLSSDVLLKPGNKEGQVIMVKNDSLGLTEAHQWANNEWVKVGEVLGADSASSSGRKVEYNGKMYDFVFDVDVKDDSPSLKLPFNLTDNPYTAAENFLSVNMLPMTYLQDVVNFILQNTKGISLGTQNNSNLASTCFNDPYSDRSFITFEAFKKPLIVKGINSYNDKVDDISGKFTHLELKQIDSLLNDVSVNANRIYADYCSKIILSTGDLIGYDLLRIIIRFLSNAVELTADSFFASFSIMNKKSSEISNSDAAKLIMIGRCICNLLVVKDPTFNKAMVDIGKWQSFYNVSIKPSNNVKDSVKEKFKLTLDGLKNNLSI